MALRPTLDDIAKACAVGKSTVSRALSGNPHVDAGVRRKIVEKAEELGYRPDPALRVLAEHRWHRQTGQKMTLAVLSVRAGRSGGRTLYAESIQRCAETLGYQIEEFTVLAGSSADGVGRVLYNRGIRGILIPPVIHPVTWDLDWSQFSPVGCGIGEFRLPIHSVDLNHFSAVRQCWKQCVSRGYQRIGAALFRQPGPDNNDSLRHAAIYYEQHQAPSSMVRIPIFDGGIREEKEFYTWFDEYRPDVLIGLSRIPFWYLKKRGLRIPQDIGFCQVLEPFYSSGTSCDGNRIAECAVKWVDQLLRSNECGLPAVADELLIEPTWVDRGTLRPVSQTKGQ